MNMSSENIPTHEDERVRSLVGARIDLDALRRNGGDLSLLRGWTDAAARGASGIVWGAIVFVFPFAAPVYVAYRTRLPARTEPADSTEQWIGAFGIGTTAAIVVSSSVTPPDPATQVLYLIPLTLAFVPAAAVVCYDPGWRALVSRA